MNTRAASFDPLSDELFRDAFDRVFESPSGASMPDAKLSVSIVPSPVGTLLLTATDTALCGLKFIDAANLETRLRSLRKRTGASIRLAPNQVLDQTRRQLEEYFAGRRTTFDIPLSYSEGSVFQQKVWSTLLRIDYGRTWSYLELARSIGDPSATRAVGMANGANPLANVIPCHRVVNADGALGGYGGGLSRKRILLDLEKGQAQFAF